LGIDAHISHSGVLFGQAAVPGSAWRVWLGLVLALAAASGLLSSLGRVGCEAHITAASSKAGSRAGQR